MINDPVRMIHKNALIIIFSLLFGCVSFVSNRSDTQTCSFNDSSFKNGFTSNVGGQDISVIGWYHGTSERVEAELTLTDTIRYAQLQQCQKAKQRVNKYLENYAKQVENGKQVLRELKYLYAERPFDIIGLEYTPTQYKSNFVDSKTSEDFSTKFIDIFKYFCPKENSQFVELTLVFPGPEFKFAYEKKGEVRLDPLDDDKLVRAAMDGYSNDSKSFIKKLNELSTSGLKVFNQFSVKLNKQSGYISKTEIEELISSIKEPEKSKLKKYFMEVLHVMSFNDERNRLFLDKIIRSKQNSVLVVGNYHVKGLRRDLENRCK